MNIEMYDHNKGNSLGAVDGNIWGGMLASEGIKTCKNYKESDENSLQYANSIYKKYKNYIPNLNFEYKHLNEITKVRYVITAGVLEFVMNQSNVSEFIKDMYYISQKYIKGNSLYIKIS
jgi:hypothetical protein